MIESGRRIGRSGPQVRWTKLPGVAAAAQRGAARRRTNWLAREGTVLEHAGVLEEDRAAVRARRAHGADARRASATSASTAMRTATPFATCRRITDRGPSATSEVDLDAAIHRARMHDDRVRRSRVPAARRSGGTRGGRRRRSAAPADRARSCWMRSIMTTSVPAMPALAACRSGGLRRNSPPPASSTSARRCGYPATPSVASARCAERATRERATSPTIVRPRRARSRPSPGGSSARRAGPASGATGALRRPTRRRPPGSTARATCSCTPGSLPRITNTSTCSARRACTCRGASRPWRARTARRRG